MSARTEAHKCRRDAAYERGYADAIKEAAKEAESWAGTAEKLGQIEGATMGEDIASAIRNLRSAG